MHSSHCCATPLPGVCEPNGRGASTGGNRMQFRLTSEQEEIRSVLRRSLEEKSPPTAVRRLMETRAGWERDSWRELNQQLDLTAVHIPEAYGGQGFRYMH